MDRAAEAERDGILENVAINLRRLRYLKALTQGDLSALTGVSKQTISSVESGRYRARAYTLAALADGLGCPVEQLTTPKGTTW